MSDHITGLPSEDKPWMNYYPFQWNENTVQNQSMYDLVREANRNREDRTAIIYFGNHISYRELFAETEQARKAFYAFGLRKGDVVSILSLNTPETTYSIYALNSLGVTVNLPVVTNTTEELEKNIAFTDSKMVLILDEVLDKYPDIDFKVPVIILPLSRSAGMGLKLLRIFKKHRKYQPYNDFIACASDDDAVLQHDENNAAVILYTSGSTGQPKGVVLSSRNLNSIAVMCTLTDKNYKPGERFLNILPPFFSFGVEMHHLCLCSGMTEIVALIPKEKNIIHLLNKYKPERYVFGPVLIDTILKCSEAVLSNLIDLTGGGGTISKEAEAKLNDRLMKCNSSTKYLEGYGMTELSSVVTMNHNSDYCPHSIGYPLPGINLKVISPETGEELSYMQEGELLVSSPGIMTEYFRNKSETNSIIEKDTNGLRWLHTGDIARINEDGFVFIVGRIKRIYITTDENNTAYKLFPQRMEDIISELPVVRRCGVVVIPHKKRQNIPVVFFEAHGSPGHEQTCAEIRKWIREKLPSYYEPEEIYFLETIPTTTTQKIDYRKLERLAAAEENPGNH